MEDPRIIYTEEIIFPSLPSFTDQKPTPVAESDHEMKSSEALKEQVKELLKPWCEMILELGRGCRDVLQQTEQVKEFLKSKVTEDSFIVQKLGGPVAKVSSQLNFLNEFLPQEHDPIHAWPVIFFVFILALSALNLNGAHDVSAPPVKKVLVHPPSASRIQLPDGRHLTYRAMGVPVDKARFFSYCTVIST
ncbi:uncharacterized protein LOC120187103 [Hibiscus syriacus]|uniref:uncharacterized protein LOC120186961 n=1 Tax=Hibiscus syriacus TaxID=106335 RepID=UPI0019207CDE|nr:uncharacterized protein LOC120186961 [Hibiscus syriacus]XP_039046832.1 uncharacterized protein LOC120187103 [Hibiscus syriacus]